MPSPPCAGQRCSLCSKLFVPTNDSARVCAKAPMTIDYHGNVVTAHVTDPDWDVNLYLAQLRSVATRTSLQDRATLFFPLRDVPWGTYPSRVN